MPIKWFLIVWLITTPGEYEEIGERIQPTLEVCLERKETAILNTPIDSRNKLVWACMGYSK